MLVYLFAVLPAVIWGFTPILSKKGMESGGNTLQAAVVVVLVDSLLYWGVLVFTRGLDGVLSFSLDAVVVFLVAGFVGTALGRICVFAGIDRVGASISSAGISTRPLFATVLAYFWLSESVSVLTAAGILVLVVGLVVLTTSRGGDLSGWKRSDLVFPLSAAAFFGFGNVVRRFGLSTTPAAVLEAVAVNELAALIGLGGYVLVRADGFSEAPSRSYGYFAASGVLTALALLSLFEALRRGKVAVVDPLVATAPLFTTLFSYLFLSDV
ncbi:MAG: EamA family transporter, partial [Halobacteria archaeon]|nr:EamA family transporter [Halobacteria archaeon]